MIHNLSFLGFFFIETLKFCLILSHRNMTLIQVKWHSRTISEDCDSWSIVCLLILFCKLLSSCSSVLQLDCLYTLLCELGSLCIFHGTQWGTGFLIYKVYVRYVPFKKLSAILFYNSWNSFLIEVFFLTLTSDFESLIKGTHHSEVFLEAVFWTSSKGYKTSLTHDPLTPQDLREKIR